MSLRSFVLFAALACAALPASARLTLAQPAKLGAAEAAPDLSPQREAISHAHAGVRAARDKLAKAERELREQRQRRRPRGEAQRGIEAAQGQLAVAESELARAIDEGRRAGLQPGDLRALGVD